MQIRIYDMCDMKKILPLMLLSICTLVLNACKDKNEPAEDTAPAAYTPKYSVDMFVGDWAVQSFETEGKEYEQYTLPVVPKFAYFTLTEDAQILLYGKQELGSYELYNDTVQLSLGSLLIGQVLPPMAIADTSNNTVTLHAGDDYSHFQLVIKRYIHLFSTEQDELDE